MILMQAPAPGITFSGMPSGATYVADPYGLIRISNNSTLDQAALEAAGCYTLSPFGSWGSFIFDTLADLYAADAASNLVLTGTVGFPAHCAVTVQADPDNNGVWYKTGIGSGDGNWSKSSATLSPDANAVIAAGAAATATASMDGAIAAAGTQNCLPTYPTALPHEVTAISGGIGTGVGGTPGEYALTVTGGPSGHQAFGTIDSTGKVASYRNANPGISTSNTAPTYAWPASAGFTTAPTVPSATVGTIPAGRNFSSPSTDGSQLLTWTNAAGSLTQITNISQYTKGGIDQITSSFSASVSTTGTWYHLGRQVVMAETFSDLSIQRVVWLDGTETDLAPAASTSGVGVFSYDASDLYYEPGTGKQVVRATVASDLSISSADLADGSLFPVNSSLNGIAGWGDSIAAGTWINKLAALLGNRAFYNGGIGGQKTPQIVARQGGLSYPMTVASNQIVAGANTVTAINGVAIGPMASQAIDTPMFLSSFDVIARSATGYLGATHGTLSRVATNTSGNLTDGTAAEAYTFVPDAGSVVPTNLPAGTPFVIDNPYDGWINIFWPGRNDYQNLTLAQIAQYDLDMVNRIRSEKFIIMPIFNGAYGNENIGSSIWQQTLAVEQQRATMFPRNFLNIRRFMIDAGLSSVGLTPTTQDQTDIANDVYPTSLRRDNLHPNQTYGDAAIANALAKFITAKGW